MHRAAHVGLGDGDGGRLGKGRAGAFAEQRAARPARRRPAGPGPPAGRDSRRAPKASAPSPPSARWRWPSSTKFSSRSQAQELRRLGIASRSRRGPRSSSAIIAGKSSHGDAHIMTGPGAAPPPRSGQPPGCIPGRGRWPALAPMVTRIRLSRPAPSPRASSAPAASRVTASTGCRKFPHHPALARERRQHAESTRKGMSSATISATPWAPRPEARGVSGAASPRPVRRSCGEGGERGGGLAQGFGGRRGEFRHRQGGGAVRASSAAAIGSPGASPARRGAQHLRAHAVCQPLPGADPGASGMSPPPCFAQSPAAGRFGSRRRNPRKACEAPQGLGSGVQRHDE
jgi:hypothetical protein